MDSEELSFNMKQQLWTLALVLALLKTRLNFFYGEMEVDGTLETQSQISTKINHATQQFPMHGSSECFPCDPVEDPYFYQ